MEKKLSLMDTIALCNTWKPHDRFVCSNTILTLTPAPNLLSDININIIMGSIEPFNIYVEMNIFFFRRYFLSPTDVSVCECVKCHVALNKFRSFAKILPKMDFSRQCLYHFREVANI